MELKQLEYYLQLCDDLSFTGAARKLFITQQALSRSIHNLEKELGVPLFVRNSGNLKKNGSRRGIRKSRAKSVKWLKHGYPKTERSKRPYPSALRNPS